MPSVHSRRRVGRSSPEDGVTKSPHRKSPYKRHPKPPYSYVGLISMAIMTSPNQQATLADINAKLQSWFPFFTSDYIGWKDSVRHNLSNNKCFKKMLRCPNLPMGKRNFWLVDVTLVPQSFITLQKTAVSRSADFPRFLHHHLHLPSLWQLANVNQPEQTTSNSEVNVDGNDAIESVAKNHPGQSGRRGNGMRQIKAGKPADAVKMEKADDFSEGDVSPSVFEAARKLCTLASAEPAVHPNTEPIYVTIPADDFENHPQTCASTTPLLQVSYQVAPAVDPAAFALPDQQGAAPSYSALRDAMLLEEDTASNPLEWFAAIAISPNRV